MNEYRLTDLHGQKMLFAADCAKTAVRCAKSDGYIILKVEKFDGGWVTLKNPYWSI